MDEESATTVALPFLQEAGGVIQLQFYIVHA